MTGSAGVSFETGDVEAIGFVWAVWFVAKISLGSAAPAAEDIPPTSISTAASFAPISLVLSEAVAGRCDRARETLDDSRTAGRAGPAERRLLLWRGRGRSFSFGFAASCSS